MGIVFHKRLKRDVSYSIRVDENTLEKIKEIAYKEDLSVNETINQCLEYVVEEYGREQK